MSTHHQTEIDIIPPVLDTPEFRDAWAEWVAHRTNDGRKTYSPRARRMALTRMVPWGPAAATAAIIHSIAGEFQGIYPDPAFQAGQSTAKSQAKPLSTWAIQEKLKAISNELEGLQYEYYGPDAEHRNRERIARANHLLAQRRKLKEQLLTADQ